MKPRIAITIDAERKKSPKALSTYRAAVERAGGEPVLLAPSGQTNDPESLLAQFDGLLLPGGADVDPSEYGGREHPGVTKAPADLDAFEMSLVRAAARSDIPTLAICRGIQVMNVALGGTLIEDIPDQYAAPNGLRLQHQQVPDHARSEPTHPVDLKPGSILEDIAGTLTINTNSMHHQGLRRLAYDLVASGTSRDGMVEAVEARQNNAFFVGVQWHPEDMVDRDEPSRALFREFVSQAEKFSARRRAQRD